MKRSENDTAVPGPNARKATNYAYLRPTPLNATGLAIGQASVSFDQEQSAEPGEDEPGDWHVAADSATPGERGGAETCGGDQRQAGTTDDRKTAPPRRGQSPSSSPIPSSRRCSHWRCGTPAPRGGRQGVRPVHQNQLYAAQQDNVATLVVKLWAASFRPSFMVRYGAQVLASWSTVQPALRAIVAASRSSPP